MRIRSISRLSSKHIVICRILIILFLFAPLRSRGAELRRPAGRCLFGRRLRLRHLVRLLSDLRRTNPKPQGSVCGFLDGRDFPSLKNPALNADHPWSAEIVCTREGGSLPIPRPNPWASKLPAIEAHPKPTLVKACWF